MLHNLKKSAAIWLGMLASAGGARGWVVKPIPQPITAAINPAHWTTVPLPARAYTIATHGGCFWAAGAEEMIARSCDGTKSWVLLHWKHKGQTIYDLAFTGTQSLYAYGNSGTRWSSRNDGQTWKSKYISPDQLPLTTYFLNPQEGIKNFGGYFTFRLQNSKPWETLPLQPAIHITSTRQIFHIEPSNIAIINGQFATAFIRPRTFYLTTDGGRHWHTQNLPANIKVLRLTAMQNGYLASILLTRPLPIRRAMLYSPDGTTWYQLNTNFASRLRHCRHNQCLLDKGWVRLQHLPNGDWQAQGWKLAPAAPDPYLPWAARQNTLCFAANHLRCAQATPNTPAALLYTPAELQAHATQPKMIKAYKNTLCLVCYVPLRPPQLIPNYIMPSTIISAIFRRDGTIQTLKLKSCPSKLIAQQVLNRIQYSRFAPILKNHKTVQFNVYIIFEQRLIYSF